ncbi:TolC family protein [Flavobacterium sp. UMI-01]|uniref:TolC family protein n=1 Tax=Flavobacterium sp. UMI-01 TaxID=1441053 RepID=UPI001C7D5FBF|nr:TolC family protein [Flavobacterium sp. UMI-01]GIZ10375.1 transporter [Flavobacterium sp. UMI-01]
MKIVIGVTFFYFVFLSHWATAQVKKWTLEDCVRYAMQKNISIQLSALETQAAAIDTKQAFGNFLPTVNAASSHSWNIGLNQDITTGILQNKTTQFSSASGTIGVDLYKGLQNQNALRKANLAKVAARYQLQKMKEDVALNVANAYLQVLFNIENVKVQKEQLKIDEQQYARTQELVKAGTIPRGDLLDSKATLALDGQKIVNATNLLEISKLSLAQLLQLTDFKNFEIAAEAPMSLQSEVLKETPESVLEVAKQQRVELKLAQTNLEIAEKNIQIAKGNLQPSLRGFYNFNTRISYADIALRDSNGAVIGVQGAPPFWEQFNDNKGQSFGAQLNIPIFNGFSARNAISRSKVEFEKSKIALEQQNLDLERNVYTAFTDAKGALQAYESALESLFAREESYRYAKEKFEVGLMNSFDLSQSQLLLSNAQSEVLRTKYDAIFKIKILEFYFGIPIVKQK